ncbi:hypothetical protein Tco_0919673, partial [Tanacetum coccineum]
MLSSKGSKDEDEWWHWEEVEMEEVVVGEVWLEEESLVEFMVELFEEDEDGKSNEMDGLFNLKSGGSFRSFSLDVVRSLSLEYKHVAMNLTLLEQVDTTSIFICTCTKIVSNKVEGRIWLCHSPVFGWSNLRIREDRPVIRTSQSRQHNKSES